jgi:hypothetical protein
LIIGFARSDLSLDVAHFGLGGASHSPPFVPSRLVNSWIAAWEPATSERLREKVDQVRCPPFLRRGEFEF